VGLTIFVVNDLQDRTIASQFANLGSFTQAFAFAGAVVVPASRPFDASHESGHMFRPSTGIDVDLVFNPQTGR
jgi:hypothetical protein